MIQNIIDRRNRQYRWKSINAIIEATSQDNVCDDADQQPPSPDDITYDERASISLADAISWALPNSPLSLFIFTTKGEALSPIPTSDVLVTGVNPVTSVVSAKPHAGRACRLST